jgi:hypothetical protein
MGRKSTAGGAGKGSQAGAARGTALRAAKATTAAHGQSRALWVAAAVVLAAAIGVAAWGWPVNVLASWAGSGSVVESPEVQAERARMREQEKALEKELDEKRALAVNGLLRALEVRTQ